MAILFLPVLMLYGGGYIYDLIYDEGFLGKPFFWGYLTIAMMVYISNMLKFSVVKLMSFIIPFSVLLTAYVYYTQIEDKKDTIETSQLEDVRFNDELGNEYILNDFKEKLVLFEFWTTSCSQCPESIAEFQELAEKYKSNENIDFRVVNINLGKRQNQDVFDKIESKIKLEKLYVNELIFKQLNFNVAPTVLVLDVQGKIVYFGYPNFDKLTHNYLPSIIENELTKM